MDALRQVMLFLEDVSDVAEVLDADLEDMDEPQQVQLRSPTTVLCIAARQAQAATNKQRLLLCSWTGPSWQVSGLLLPSMHNRHPADRAWALAGAQAELMRGWVRKHALSRTREQAGLPCRPMREARVPLQLSEAQVRALF